jgi:ribosomal protein L11 methyltransferase
VTLPEIWFEVLADVEAGDVDNLSGDLWAAGVAGIEERPGGGGEVRLALWVTSDRLACVRQVIGAREVGVEVVARDSGLDEWRQWASPWRVDRVLVRPAWISSQGVLEDGPGPCIDVAIDPGRAFGSGSHPSTRLALAALQQLDLHDTTVLDVGTGTGVLAIAAALLDARWVAAVDIDPAAVEIAAGNARRNGVDDRLEVSDDEVGSVRSGPFDVVVANVTAGVLVELATEVSGHVRAGGHLVLSGLLVDQRAAVLEAYPALRLVAEDTEGEWAGLVLTR